MAAPLEGVRVADFTWVLAGPTATKILADLGAEVIKIERKAPGLAALGDRRSGINADSNRNKLSIAIDLRVPAGVELARRLVAVSDLVVENFSARVMRQLGLDYQSLAAVKPDIICLSMSGFGHSGPHSHQVSYGPTIQARSGFTHMMTDRPGQAVGFGYSYADLAAGHTGALAALFALWHRKRTGQGQFIDLAQFEALINLTGPGLLDAAVNERAQEPPIWRAQEAPAAPHGVYRCRPAGEDRDRWLVIVVRSHTEWRHLVSAMGSPAWASEPRFHTLFSRLQHHTALDEHISSWTAGLDAYEAMARLQKAGVAAAVVSNGEDLCALDPQLAARGFWRTAPLAGSGEVRLSSLPFRFSRSPVAAARCAPEVDRDRDYVLEQVLGLDGPERARLVAAKAIEG